MDAVAVKGVETFIANERERGIDDVRIKAALVAKGWPLELVDKLLMRGKTDKELTSSVRSFVDKQIARELGKDEIRAMLKDSPWPEQVVSEVLQEEFGHQRYSEIIDQAHQRARDMRERALHNKYAHRHHFYSGKLKEVARESEEKKIVPPEQRMVQADDEDDESVSSLSQSLDHQRKARRRRQLEIDDDFLAPEPRQVVVKHEYAYPEDSPTPRPRKRQRRTLPLDDEPLEDDPPAIDIDGSSEEPQKKSFHIRPQKEDLEEFEQKSPKPPTSSDGQGITIQNATISVQNPITSPQSSAAAAAPPKDPEAEKAIHAAASIAHPQHAHISSDSLDKLESRFKLLMENQMQQYSGSHEFRNPLMPDEVQFVSEPKGDRAQTGIQGFDPVVEGGIKRGTTSMVAGGPGTGKTTFALQYLYNGAVKYNEAGIMITFEQRVEDIIEEGKVFGWDLQGLMDKRILSLREYSPEQLDKMLKAGGGSFRDLIESTRASRVVIDSITAFMLLYDGEIAQRRACLELFHSLAKWGCTTFVVVEEEYNISHHSSSVLEYETDAVIILYNERRGDIRQRSLEIYKMRGTKHAGRIFPMRLTSEGMVVYPRQEF